MAEPDLVFPNYGDHAYAKIELDRALRSTTFAAGWSVSRTTCCATSCGRRCGRWCATASCPRPNTSPSAATQLPSEPDQDIVEVFLERVAMTLVRYVPEARRNQEAHAWFELARGTRRSNRRRSPDLWARSAIRAGSVSRRRGRLAAHRRRLASRSAALSLTRRCAGRSASGRSPRSPDGEGLLADRDKADRPIVAAGLCSRRRLRVRPLKSKKRTGIGSWVRAMALSI